MIAKPYPWQAKQWQSLMAANKNQRVSHALLLSGPSGTGKLEFAHALAAKLLCASQDSLTACGKCHPCTLLKVANHPDVMSIGLSEKSKIIKAKDLRDWLRTTLLSPMMSQQKVAIVNHADQMTPQAANSFLKILEEPAGNTTFILVSQEKKPLLATIKSRCQTTLFPAVEPEQALQWLRTELPNEEIEVLWDMSHGAPLQARAYHDSPKIAHYQSVVTQLTTIKQANIFSLAMQWSKEDVGEILGWWQALVVHMLKSDRQSLANPTISCPVNESLDFYQKLLEARRMVMANINTRLILDTLLSAWVKIRQQC